MNEELDALRRYIRAAIAIATHRNATDEHGEALDEAIIQLNAVRAMRPSDAADINVLIGNPPVSARARPWRLRPRPCWTDWMRHNAVAKPTTEPEA